MIHWGTLLQLCNLWNCYVSFFEGNLEHEISHWMLSNFKGQEVPHSTLFWCGHSIKLKFELMKTSYHKQGVHCLWKLMAKLQPKGYSRIWIIFKRRPDYSIICKYKFHSTCSSMLITSDSHCYCKQELKSWNHVKE